MGVQLSETPARTWKSQGEYVLWPLPFVLGDHNEKGGGGGGLMGPTPLTTEGSGGLCWGNLFSVKHGA